MDIRLSERALVIAAFDKGISFTDLAKRVGISRATMSNYKAGRRCSDEIAAKIAGVLDTTVENLQE